MTYAIPTIIILAALFGWLAHAFITAPIGYEQKGVGFRRGEPDWTGSDAYLEEMVRRALHSDEGVYPIDFPGVGIIPDPRLSQIINEGD